MSKRFLGLDLGESKIGLALSDSNALIAQPYQVLQYRGRDTLLSQLREIVLKEEVSALVVGLPYNKDGGLGRAAEKVKETAAFLEENLKLPLEFIDERFTSLEVAALLREEKLSLKRKKRASHSVAAALILQTFLDLRKRV